MKLETKYTLTLPNNLVVELTRDELDSLWRELQVIYGYKEKTSYPIDQETLRKMQELADKIKNTPDVVKPPWDQSPWRPPEPTYVKADDKIIC